jgi:acetyl-CoA C-acetyltransferase
MKDDVVIVSATRTPVGAFNGAFATIAGPRTRQDAIKAALERAGVEPRVSEVIMGQILTAGAGPEPGPPGLDRGRHPGRKPGLGRQHAVRLGPAHGGARLPGASLNGDSEIVVAGGQESMSMAPHAQYLRGGVKMGNFEMIDTMIKDGLWDAFNGYHMGNTAENVARQWQITRAAAGRIRGRLAEQGRGRAEGRQVQGRDRPVTIKSRKGDIVVDTDEYPKHGTTLEAIGKLRRPSTRTAPSPPAAPRASMTAPPRWC